MPEGPELHLASLYVNRLCNGLIFTGAVRKSEVSKCPDVSFTCEAYRITATSRGKEVKLTLTPMKSQGQADQPVDIFFRFGMSGYFRLTTEDELPKHSHLRFYSNEEPCRVLSFVDTRRFGSWQPGGTWQPSRGPCVITEYESFRENVLLHLSDRAFDRPICEVLLNQKYFNGIGNYLRAEILFSQQLARFLESLQEPQINFPERTYVCISVSVVSRSARKHAAVGVRLNQSIVIYGTMLCSLSETHKRKKTVTGRSTRLNIPPFVSARSVFELLESEEFCENKLPVKAESGDTKPKMPGRKRRLKEKEEKADLLTLCHTVPVEVVNLGGTFYDPEKADYSDFKAWLQCYCVDGMKSVWDHNGRTIWFKGDPGPMVPKDLKSPKVKKWPKKKDHDYTDKKVATSRSADAPKQEPGIKSADGKGSQTKQAASKIRKKEINQPQNESGSTARGRKTGAQQTEAGPLRRSARVARQSSK